MSSPTYQFLASCPRGLSDLLAQELTLLGAQDLQERATGVSFGGALRAGYRVCLESRLANRVYLQLARFAVNTADEFYNAVRALDWSAHLDADRTLACEFSGLHPAITNTHYGALRLKDAVVDSVRSAQGLRPNVSLERPDVRLHAHARGINITLSLDLAGESLHRRGYREEAGAAPLAENVAAGILLRSGWPAMAADGAPFCDPMCGSGTFVIEAALIASDHAPGLLRSYFGFLGWRGHDRQLWELLVQEAQQRSTRAQSARQLLRGQDQAAHAIRQAQANAARAGVAHLVQFAVQELAQAAPAPGPPGLLCVNPPYGVRLEDPQRALLTHRELGEVLRAHFAGWTAAILIGAPELGKELGLRAFRTHALWNGGLECRLLRLRIDVSSERTPGRLGRAPAVDRDSPGARMFANRLAKNLKRLRGWADRAGVSCYRLYDADMPEYAFAIDLYQTIEPQTSWLYVQEYAAPPEIEREAVRRRRAEMFAVLPEVSGVAPEHIHVRTRRRSRHGEQYRKVATHGEFLTVSEGGLRFLVNFGDYLDTGLFLDHRLTRERLRASARGVSFLNLFAYTGTASVYAAAGGAEASVSVDLSHTYLDWAQRNLALNGCNQARHRCVQADCREWLLAAVALPQRYQLIFLDPPTFSNSKRMQGVLDVARDHGALIDLCMRLLTPDGLLLFSTNAQRFRLDEPLRARYAVRDISADTLPLDFARNGRIHQCFEIRAADPTGLLYSARGMR